MAKPQKTFDIAASGPPARSRMWIWVVAGAIVAAAVVAIVLRTSGESGTDAPAPAPAAGASTGGAASTAAAPAQSPESAGPQSDPPTPAPAPPGGLPARLQATAHFAFGRADVDAAELADIGAAAAGMRGVVTISGHTDDVGDTAVNQALSDARAQAVETWLRSRGLPPGVEIRAQGFGEAQPVCSDSTDECRARNRRADVVLERR